MKILILGNSSIFQRKALPSLKKIRKINIEIASKRNINFNHNYKTYKSYATAINKSKAKVVYISLINSEHFKWALYCLKKNKHVLIDKPITTNHIDTLKLISTASKKKLFLSEVIFFHKHRQFEHLIKYLNFKKPIKLNSKFHIPKLSKKNFRNYKKFGGGCFQDMSTYAAYLFYLFFKNDNFQILKLNNKKKFANFNLVAKHKNILIRSSFKFNSSYKNEMTIDNAKYRYKVNFIFAPPIDNNTNIRILDKNINKNYIITLKKQNAFDKYFSYIFNLIKKKKYNYYYNEIKKISEIRQQIS